MITLISTSPEDLEAFADIGPVSAVWEATEPFGDLTFEIERDSVLYDLAIVPLGNNQYRVSANVGLMPDEQEYMVIFRAEGIIDAEEEEAITFTTRPPLGEVQGRAQIFFPFPSQAAALANIFQFGEAMRSHARQIAQTFPSPRIAQRDIGSLDVRVFRVVSDYVRAQLPVAQAFLRLAAMNAVESGDPLTPDASLLSMEVESFASFFDGTRQITVLARNAKAAPASLNVGLPALEPVAESSIEIGQPTVSESMHSLEKEEGNATMVVVDLLDDVLGGARE